MRKYEIGFIINPEAGEEEVKKIIDSIVEIVQNQEGKIENIDEWGRRKLAFPIQRHNEGIYIFISAEAPGTVFTKVERRLKLNEKVMRFIMLRLDERMQKSNRLVKKWKKSESMSRRPQPEEEDVPVKDGRGSRKEIENEE